MPCPYHCGKSDSLAAHSSNPRVVCLPGALPGNASAPDWQLLGAATEEAQDDAGGDPIVVLVGVGAERCTVVVGIEQTDVNVPGRVHIEPAADLERETVLRSVVSAAP